MSYGKDPDILLRGIGAIASRDAGSIVQLRRRQARARVLRRRDAKLSRMTYEQRAAMGLGGPGLTADTRTLKLTSYGPGSAAQLPVKPTGVNSVGVRPMYVPPPAPFTTTPGFTSGTPKPPKDPVTGVDTPRGPTTTPTPPPMTMYVCSDGTRVADPSLCAQPIVVPTAPPQTTGGGGGGGGGGGSMMFTCPDGTKVADLSQCPQPAPSSTPMPDLPAGKDNTLLIAAGIGILYLLFRDKKDQR